MKHGMMTLACIILLALTSVVPEASAQDERSTPAEVSSVRAAREEPMLVAHRRRHCHTVHRHVA
jgi:hypothetical protein